MSEGYSMWAEIALSRLTANFQSLNRAAGPDEVLAVAKANAYGHGVLACAPALMAAGARWLGVTSVEEALAVRAGCPTARVLVMAGPWRGEAAAMVEHGLTPSVWEPFHLEELGREARRQGLAKGSVPVHLEVDTGMARQGVRGLAALGERLAQLESTPALRIEGVMTHFSSPDELDSPETELQLSVLAEALKAIGARGHRPELVSAGNSATLVSGLGVERLRSLAHLHGARLMLRPGLALYGYPVRFMPEQVAQPELLPVLSWKARVLSLRTLEPGEPSGYNATFRAARPTRLALLRVGYADGLSRLLSNRGQVLVRGQRAPIAGRISMDQTMVDVTEIPGVEIGDEAILIGQQGEERITAYELADLSGTIPYEVLCGISARVPRVVVE